jgi:hypothetical protein
MASKTKKQSAQHHIVCHVSGGVLQDVFSNDANTKVTLFDFDNFDGEEKDTQGRTEEEATKQFEEMTADMTAVF